MDRGPVNGSSSSPKGCGRQTVIAETARLGLGPGIRAGLFGGSFNPAHRGHLAVAEAARRACRLDRVVWLVSPGNPLKSESDYMPTAERMARAKALTDGRPWLVVSGIENELGTRYTADMLLRLERLTRADLVWIMGADSFADFDRWRGWRGIAGSVPMVIVSRPGQSMRALKGRAARTLSQARLASPAALPGAAPPAWGYLNSVHEPISATAIRARISGIEA